MPVHCRVAAIFVAVVLVAVAIVGCSSTTRLPTEVEPAHTGTVTGRVVKAHNTAETLPRSRISTADGAVSTRANDQGQFVLRGIPLPA